MATAVSFAFVLSYDDGRADFFDHDGNLVVRTDRFGNRTDMTWEAAGPQRWRPTSIVDSYGRATTFAYAFNGSTSQVKVTAPTRSDGLAATTTIDLNDLHDVVSVTDPTGSTARFDYTSVPGVAAPLLATVVSALGAQTRVRYQQIPSVPGLTAVQSVVTTDGSGHVMGPARLFSMNPTGNVAQHNYAGFPDYVGGGSDRLFESGDPTYRYLTALVSCPTTASPPPTQCPGSPTSTISTYDSQHRLVDREIVLGQATVQKHVMTYPAVRRGNLDANYARPTSASVTSLTPGPGQSKPATRTVTTTRTYDDHGRVTKATNETGAVTTTTYDSRFGLVTGEHMAGVDGSQQQLSRTLDPDGKTVVTSSSAVAAKGQGLQPRSTTTYTYDTSGQLTSSTMTWAPGAKPTGSSGGPDTVTTRYDRKVDLVGGTVSIDTTIATGTSDAATATQAVDLTTGLTVRAVTATGLTTTYGYDAGGHPTTVTTPDGLTTITSVRTASNATQGGKPALPAGAGQVQTVTGPDGHVTVTSTDVIGRTMLVTDNVKAGAFVSDPAARRVAATSYSPDGTTVTGIDQVGRTTTSKSDALGRPVSQVSPVGATTLTGYDDAAHTVTRQLFPTGLTPATGAPVATQTTTYDNLNRATQLASSYTTPPGTPAEPAGRGRTVATPLQTVTYDGVGSVTGQSAEDLSMAVTYAPGGVRDTSTFSPQAPDSFPGRATTVDQNASMTGDATSSTRQQPGASPAAGSRLTYDATGRTATSTDPNGRTTTFTYRKDGRVATTTDPSGTVTTNRYDDQTGRLRSVEAAPNGGTALTKSFTYVPAGQPGAGELMTTTEGDAIVTLGYDADGHVVSRRYSDGTSTLASYRDDGLLATTTDVTGAVTTYGYDTLGRLTSTKQARGTAALASTGYTYDALSRVSTITRGNGATTTNEWTARNQLSSQTTVNAGGVVVEAHAYTYDTHNNVVTRTDTTPTVAALTEATTPTPPGQGTPPITSPGKSPLKAAPATETWTTAYRYDAYNQLLGSAVYTGSSATGTPTTTTSYTLDVAGNVTTVETSTATAADNGAPKPKRGNGNGNGNGNGTASPGTRRVNTIDPAGQLTTQVTTSPSGASSTASQAFDGDGRVTTSLSGTATAYDAFGRPVTAGVAGTTTQYTYWPDGTRRAATTTAGGASTTVTYHYGVDQNLANDTTVTGSGQPVTASYLVAAGREARTLQPGTTATGAVASAADAGPQVSTGPAVGYLLTDRHSSVTSMFDTAGSVSGVYHYTDYGAPANANGQASSSAPLPLADLGVGRVNPFRYAGGTARAGYTDPVTGLLVLPARTYDAAQGRFTERDTASIFNRYQGFSANPVNILDPTGHISLADILLDVGMFIAFAVATIATAGAASAAFGVIAAATEAGTAVAATTVVAAASTTVAAVASATGLAASATRLGDTLDDAVTGKHFLSSGQRKTLGTVETAAGAVAAAAGLVTAGSAAVGAAADAADAAEGGVAADAESAYEAGEIQPEAKWRVKASSDEAGEIQPEAKWRIKASNYDADDVASHPLDQDIEVGPPETAEGYEDFLSDDEFQTEAGSQAEYFHSPDLEHQPSSGANAGAPKGGSSASSHTQWSTDNGKALLADKLPSAPGDQSFGDDIRDSSNTVDMPTFLDMDTSMKLKR